MTDSPEAIDRIAIAFDEATGSIEGHGLWFAMDEAQRDRWRAAVCVALAELRNPGCTARAEREACAKLADERAEYWRRAPRGLAYDGKPEIGPSLHEFEDVALAAAIRARS